METVLLSFLVRSLPPCSSRDIPVYLPYGSPKVQCDALWSIQFITELIIISALIYFHHLPVFLLVVCINVTKTVRLHEQYQKINSL